jgi:hypothetical protein
MSRDAIRPTLDTRPGALSTLLALDVLRLCSFSLPGRFLARRVVTSGYVLSYIITNPAFTVAHSDNNWKYLRRCQGNRSRAS